MIKKAGMILGIVILILSVTGACGLYMDGVYLHASDGEYKDRVKLSWENYTGHQAVYYRLEKSTDGNSYTPLADGLTVESYIDTTVIPGVPYYYRLNGYYGIDYDLETDKDVGFAMDATILPSTLQEGAEPLVGTTGNTQIEYAWFEVMAVKGMITTLETLSSGNDVFDTVMEVFPPGSVTAAVAADDNSGMNNFAKLDLSPAETGKYYIRIRAAAAAGSFKIQAWLH